MPQFILEKSVAFPFKHQPYNQPAILPEYLADCGDSFCLSASQIVRSVTGDSGA